MKRFLFCLAFLLVFSGFVCAEIFSNGASHENIQNGNIVYEINDEGGGVLTKSSDGKTLFDFSGFETGSRVELDSDGNLNKISGVAGENGSNLTLNGRTCNLPAGSKLDFDKGVSKVKARGAGDKLSCFREAGEEETVISMPDGEILISKDVDDNDIFSSSDSFEVYSNGGNVHFTVGNFSYGKNEASVSINSKGELVGFDNARISFVEDGVDVFSDKHSDFYYDEFTYDDGANCKKIGSYFCLDKSNGGSKFFSGSDGKTSGPLIEFTGEDDVKFLEISSLDYEPGLNRISPFKSTVEETQDGNFKVLVHNAKIRIAEEIVIADSFGDFLLKGNYGSSGEFPDTTLYSYDGDGEINDLYVEAFASGVKVKDSNGVALVSSNDVDLGDLGDKLYSSFSEAETGGEVDPFTRTTVYGSGSSAYGPAQLTKILAEDYLKKNIWTEEERLYLNKFIGQGELFLKWGGRDMPEGGIDPETGEDVSRYDYGGSGDLTSEYDKAIYEQVVKKMLLHTHYRCGGDLECTILNWKEGEGGAKVASTDTDEYRNYYRRLIGGS